MKIYIRDIRPEGINVHYAIPVEAMGFTKDDYLQFVEPLDVQARVERVEDTVLAKTKVKSRYHSFCARTLVEVERDWQSEFLLDFPIDRATEFIDIDDDVRQEVILGLPVRILCDAELAKEERIVSERLDESASANPEKKTYKPFKDLKLK